ncbi:MAG: hypothetical protein C0501_30685 [Isosphaera sp.]|nr:hypothetical protein [Isosphaera sp.]
MTPARLAPALLVAVAALAPARPDAPKPAAPAAADAVLTGFVRAHCVSCHGPDQQKGKLRLDTLAPAADAWKDVLDRVESGDMPPKDAKARPTAEEVARVTRLLRDRLRVAASDLAFPGKGNLVDHDALFGKPTTAPTATPARLWRVSPFAYRGRMHGLVGQPIPGEDEKIDAKKQLVVLPFGLSTDPGFRDYAFRYTVTGSETEQLVLNAKAVLEYVLRRQPRYAPPKALVTVAEGTAAPTDAQLRAAVGHLFDHVLLRDPTADEADRYAKFLASAVAKFGNRKGLVHGLTPVLLHPEAVFRMELGAGKPDEHGRVMLAPVEAALAVSYALTDARPDPALVAAARSGKLATPADVRREVTRLLDDPKTPKPRVLRFFREYFGYPAAADLFKDDPVIKAADIGSQYRPHALVEDTDRLVEWVLAKDRDVLRELLTTDRSFVGHNDLEQWNRFKTKREADAKAAGVAPATHPYGGKKNKLNEHYNLPAEKWSADGMPFTLPKEQRAGVLTQPAWLIAHSTNDGNHAIHRGKWVRERLLGGSIPDTPVTVEAKLPDEPEHTLRHRMRVTREAYCWACHQKMDPLGLPFEQFDHFGRHRTTELGKPVDTSGEVVGGGDPALDGPVTDAVSMVRKLAASERVAQVFVRHAFRYWLGRNETPADAPTLQAAYAAYRDGGGSMKALVAALLTSDAFLYRTTK